ncbi:MAG: hypothetical protein ABL885_08815 [Methylophilaceae bacterium]
MIHGDNYNACTPVTPRYPGEVTEQTPPLRACTPVTPVTPQKTIICNESQNVHSWWIIRDRNGIEKRVSSWPPVSHSQILAAYPEATEAEPLPERNNAVQAHSESEVAYLVDITERVLRHYGCDADEVAEGVAIALADYDSALTCYRDLVKRLRLHGGMTQTVKHSPEKSQGTF